MAIRKTINTTLLYITMPADIDNGKVFPPEDNIHVTEEIASSKPTRSSSIQMRYRDERIQDTDKCIEKFLVALSIIMTIIFFPVSLLCIFVVVRQFERAVIFRNGKLLKPIAVGPGLIAYLPCIDIVKFVDLRTCCYDIPLREALTKDSITVTVNAVLFYKVRNPVTAVITVTDYKKSTQYLATTTLRTAVGSRKLKELLGDKSAVVQQVFNSMKDVTQSWGIAIKRVEIKNLRLTLQLQKAMAAEAETSRLASATIKLAKSEIESTKLLHEATEILMKNPICMQLRYLQSIHMLAGDKTHSIVFPHTSDDFMKNLVSSAIKENLNHTIDNHNIIEF